MNYKAITTEMLKTLRAGGAPTYAMQDGFVLITSDGIALYKVPVDNIEINLDRCSYNPVFADYLKEDDQQPAEPTGNKKTLGKCTVVELSNDSCTVLINEQYLKPFEKPIFAIGPTERNFVLVYEPKQDEPVGIIAPVKPIGRAGEI